VAATPSGVFANSFDVGVVMADNFSGSAMPIIAN
jgi:hypothetical protein